MTEPLYSGEDFGVLNAVHVCTDIEFMRNSAAASSPVKAVTVVLMFKLVFGADV